MTDEAAAARDGAAPRILVIQTAFLGDVVLTTPLFRGLKRLWPGSALAALVTPEAAPLIEEDPHLDAVLTYGKKGGERFWSALAKIRAQGFDWLVAPHRSHRTSLLALVSGVPRRVGFADAGFSWVYGTRIERPPQLHEVDRNLELLRGLAGRPEPSDRFLHVGYTPREAELVAAALSEAGIGNGEALAGICAGSIWATKRWLPEGFAEVGRRLTARGYRVILLGGPDDREVAAQVEQGIGRGAFNAAGTTPLKALPAWMDRLKILITNDSAPLHVAAARGTPTVAVFGATTRSLGFGPFHEASRVVEVDLPCRPCGLHGGDQCPEGHFRCMRQIDPGRVFAACLELGDAERPPA